MLTLMQGASGSGKSTVAKQLAAETGAVIYSSDELFIVDGEYKFNPKMLGIYHQKNLERTVEALKEGKDVIVDNTNTQRWECKGYVEAALKYGHEVKFVRCDGRYQNVHGVPNEKVDQMRNRLEDLTIDSVLASKRPF